MAMKKFAMKFYVCLFAVAFGIPVKVNTIESEATQTVSPTPTTMPLQPLETNVKNDVNNMAVSGNAANRDQTNSIVSQQNKAEKQNIIGSQTDSHDLSIAHNTAFTNNNSNTTVFNHDDHVSNQFTSQNTVNNHQQTVQNVYHVQEKVVKERDPVRHDANVGNSPTYNQGRSLIGSPVYPNQNSNPGKKIPIELFREMIQNAKLNSDLSYQLALELLSK